MTDFSQILNVDPKKVMKDALDVQYTLWRDEYLEQLFPQKVMRSPISIGTSCKNYSHNNKEHYAGKPSKPAKIINSITNQQVETTESLGDASRLLNIDIKKVYADRAAYNKHGTKMPAYKSNNPRFPGSYYIET